MTDEEFLDLQWGVAFADIALISTPLAHKYLIKLAERKRGQPDDLDSHILMFLATRISSEWPLFAKQCAMVEQARLNDLMKAPAEIEPGTLTWDPEVVL